MLSATFFLLESCGAFIRSKLNLTGIDVCSANETQMTGSWKSKRKSTTTTRCWRTRNSLQTARQVIGFSNFRSSGHKAHNSNIFELDKTLWTKTGKSLLQEHAFTKIVSTYLFSFFRQLVWKRQNQMSQNCLGSYNLRFYLAVRRVQALIRGFGAPIAFDFSFATQKHGLGPPCKVTARRGPG